MKIGTSTVTDSFTPRRFSRISAPTTTTAAVELPRRAASGGSEAEDRVGAARDRDRDREHVVDHQRAAGDHARAAARAACVATR